MTGANLAFGVALLAIVLVVGLCVASMLRPGFEFFPPPSRECWQRLVFRWLFRTFFLSLVALSCIRFELALEHSGARQLLALTLGLCGFGAALHATVTLGWRSAFGHDGGLVAKGMFRLSRNPVYAASWVGQLGWGLLLPDPRVVLLLALWAALYLLAPMVEEPWLVSHYGTSYERYRASTPRFFPMRFRRSGSA